MTSEILDALTIIAKEKGVDPDYLIDTLREGILVAAQKKYRRAPHVEVKIDHTSGQIGLVVHKRVSNVAYDDTSEIDLEQALEIEDEPILITTYTEFNAREVLNKFVKRKGCMPRNVTIQTWFSFLLQHGVRPYQSVLNESLHNKNVGFYLTNEKSGKRFIAPGEPMLSGGRPV